MRKLLTIIISLTMMFLLVACIDDNAHKETGNFDNINSEMGADDD